LNIKSHFRDVTRVVRHWGKVTPDISGDLLTSEVIRVMGTELNTHELYGDDKLVCYGLKCIFYHIFKNLSSKTMKTATSVSAIQCRIETNVVGLV